MTDDNLSIIRRVYDAFRTQDTSVIAQVFADDVEIRQTPELPWGGRYRGHEGVLSFFLKLLEHSDSQLSRENLFAAGDHVVQTGRTRGTVVANGAVFDIPEVHVWQLRNGKVIRYEAYLDTPAMLEALNRPPI